ncbi:parallel beta helix pectate lyase-like protein [Kineococcus xinjiangensis]|uniref:Parallel beta helix pectate lyase-like protein n=1 Tax=Kineococcus xinjiangensis TaxID=512762 RepID=A0A2S6ITU6_9ACTN|nr:right-handed parallel beta-helix repeat-containing protein [Kineococcus xinjiangensis]PPK97476.1 parallel beta helix pectate lyase-like protein [Kineococcus xinjiangensis]
MRTIIKIAAAAVTLPLALLTAPAATAASPAAKQVTCGSEVQGRVVLTRDLNCTGPGLIVKTSGTTIDLNGHTLRHAGGTAEWNVPGITVGYYSDDYTRTDDVTIRNGRIEGYVYAVEAVFTERLTVEGLGTPNAISSGYSGGLTVRNSRIDGGVGLDYHGAALIEKNHLGSAGGRGGGITIRNNVFTDRGVNLYEGGDSQVTGNRFTGSGGIALGDSIRKVTVEGNSVQGALTGITLYGIWLEDIEIRNNRIRNSGWSGILVADDAQSVHDVLIEGNKVTHSGFGPYGDWEGAAPTPPGIRVAASSVEGDARDVTLRGNRVRSSAGHGIFAPGGTDGGGNRASGSKVQPDCVGVTCRR